MSVDAAPGGLLLQKQQFLDVRRKLDTISTEHPVFGETLARSLAVVRRALDEFGGPTGAEGLAISFNGGKDACVVLYLLLLVLAERDQLGLLSKTTEGKGITVVYFEKKEFTEMEAFMEGVSQTYGFEFHRYALSYKDGMQDLVVFHGIKGVFMGQRRGDPWTETMGYFSPSSPGWADFTRVNPALEWRFCDVWRFLRGSGLPYCVLYDQGYTSLGERGDTAKNEALRLPNGEYRPAYELAEEAEHLERSPRTPPDGSDDSEGRRVCAGGEEAGTAVGGGRRTGRDDGNSVVPQLLKRLSSLDTKWDSLDESHHGVASKDSGGGGGEGGVGAGAGVLADDDAGGSRESRRGTRSLGTNIIIKPAGGKGEGARGRRSGYGGRGQVKRDAMALSRTTCLQPDGKEQAGLSSSWVGASMRWLPLSLMVALALAAVGLRRSGSPRGGDDSMERAGGLMKG